jgi:PAS domain S-box-containing protein
MLPPSTAFFCTLSLAQFADAEFTSMSLLDIIALSFALTALAWSAWFFRRQLRQQRALVARLTESEHRFRTLFEQSPDAVLLFDSERGIFIDCNSAALTLLRCTKAWLLEKHPWDIAPTRQPDGRLSVDVAREIVTDLQRVDSLRFEWRHGRGDGTDFPAEISETAIVINGAKTFVAVVRDVTERKRAEAELRELNTALERRVSERTSELAATNQQLRAAEHDLKHALEREKELHQLKSNFVSMVSHEFRTPMGVILSSSQILQRHLEKLPAEERAELLDSITNSVGRMAELMEEVLVLSRVESARMELKAEAMELKAFCQSLTDELMSATHRRCPIHLELETDGEISADEGLLRHILSNLISNAVKYSPENTPVLFRVSREQDHAVFVVEDRGIGIPAADHARLFDAFHRGGNVENIPGTGLGLTIVKRCVDRHGGEISFKTVEGKGTTFTVQLPLFAPSAPLSI